MELNQIYQMQDNKTINRDSCIEIQLGKQKKKKFKDSSVFFSAESFLPLEHTIWQNYREYSDDSTVKIRTEDWVKIIAGFMKLSVKLRDSVYNQKLLYILGIDNNSDKQMYKENYVLINKNIDTMIITFVNWLEPLLKENDYITISG